MYSGSFAERRRASKATGFFSASLACISLLTSYGVIT
jgi:hypothetical protein